MKDAKVDESWKRELEREEQRDNISDFKEIDWIDFVKTEFEGCSYLMPSNNPKNISSVGFWFSLFGQYCRLAEKNTDNHIIGYTQGQSIREDWIQFVCPGPDFRNLCDTDCYDVTILCYQRGVTEPVFAKCFYQRSWTDYHLGIINLRILDKLIKAGDGDYFLLVHNHRYSEEGDNKIGFKTVNGCQVCNLYIHPYGFDIIKQESECELSSRETQNSFDTPDFEFDFIFSAIMPYDKQMVRVICLNDKYDVIGESDVSSQVIETNSKKDKAWYSVPLFIKKSKLRRKTQCHIVVTVNNVSFLDYDLELSPYTTIAVGESVNPDKSQYVAHFYVNNPIFKELGLSVSSALSELSYHVNNSLFGFISNVNYADHGLRRYCINGEHRDFYKD